MEFNAQLQDENESLRQQLADHIKQVTLLWDALEEVKLRSISLADAQVTALEALAAALAACKAKDEALEQIADDDYDGSPIKIAHKALAIQPDDAALKTWLGEPVAIARVGSLMTLRQQLSSRDGEVTFDRDKIIAAAKLSGIISANYRYDGTDEADWIDMAHFYAIAFEAGRVAEREGLPDLHDTKELTKQALAATEPKEHDNGN